MIEFYEDEIEAESEFCVYCGSEFINNTRGCCGEVHSTPGYFYSGAWYLQDTDDFRILKGARPLTDEQKVELELERQYELNKESAE